MAAVRSIRFLLAVLGGAVLLALPSAASERQVIPFDLTDLDHMSVPFVINGTIHTEGLVDTAATYPMIDGHTARLTGLTDPGADAPMVNVLGVTGAQIYPVVRLARLDAGNVSFNDLPVALNMELDVPGPGNILPLKALQGDVVDFDFANKRITAYNGRPDGAAQLQPSRTRITEENGLLFVTVRINGKKGRALIDTGSGVTYINSLFAESSGTRANEEKTLKLQGATGGNLSVRVASARVMTICDYRVNQVDIMVSNPPLFDYLGLGEEPAMVLGLDFLSSFRMQIDRRRSQLVLSLPETRRNVRTINLNAKGSRIRN